MATFDAFKKKDDVVNTRVQEAAPVKVEGKPVESTWQKQEKSDPVVIVSEVDSYINDRLKSQPKTLADVEIKANQEHAEEKILALPKDLEKYADEYAFRWVKKHPRSISYHLDVMNWTIVNRIYFNELPKYLYTANGTIERGDLILCFIPLKRAQELRLEPSKRSQERVRNTPAQDLSKPWQDRGDSYYKPTSGVKDSGEEEETSEKGIVRQVD